MVTSSLPLIAMVGTICSVIFGFIGYKRGLKQEATEDGTLKSDTQYIKQRIDDVLLEQRNLSNTVNAHSERITRLEENAKQKIRCADAKESKNEE